MVLTQFDRLEHRVHMGTDLLSKQNRVNDIVSDIKPYKHVLSEHNVRLSNIYFEYDYNRHVTQLNLIVLAKEVTNYMTLVAPLKELNPATTPSIS